MMIRIRYATVLTLCLALLSSSASAMPGMGKPAADGTNGTLKFTFTSDAKPVEGVKVDLIRFTGITPETVDTKTSNKDGLVAFVKQPLGASLSYKILYSYEGVDYPKFPEHAIPGAAFKNGLVENEATVDVTFDKGEVEFLHRNVVVRGLTDDKNKNYVQIEEQYVLKNNAKLFFAGYKTLPAGEKVFVLANIPKNATNVLYYKPNRMGTSKPYPFEGGKVYPHQAIPTDGTYEFFVLYRLDYDKNGKVSFEIDSPHVAKDFRIVTTNQGEVDVTCDTTDPKASADAKGEDKTGRQMPFVDPKPDQKHTVSVKFVKVFVPPAPLADEHAGHNHPKEEAALEKKDDEEGASTGLLIGIGLGGLFVIGLLVVIKVKMGQGGAGAA